MTTRTGFFNAMAVQRRVIAAIIIREIHTRYGRDNLGFLWVMVEPLMFAGGVMGLWLMLRGSYDHNLPIVAIVLFGYLPLLLFRHTVSHALGFARPNVGLLYHRQVTLLDLIFARISLDFLGSTLAFVFAFFVLYSVGQLKWPVSIPLMLLGWFYMAWFSVGIGLIVGALSERSEIMEKIWQPISYLMLPISGAYMFVVWVPTKFREIYLLMPSVHAYEMIRGGYFGGALETYYSQSYVAYSSAILTLIGLWLVRDTRRFIIVE
jgi:capsular polysaccharide transport system permease protein